MLANSSVCPRFVDVREDCLCFTPADKFLLPSSEEAHLEAPLPRLGLLAHPGVPGGHGAVAGHAVKGPLPAPAVAPGAADARLGGVEREHGELRGRQRFWKTGKR